MNQKDLNSILQKNISDTLRYAIKYISTENCILLYDERTLLAKMLSVAYKNSIPSAHSINFDENSPDQILKEVNILSPGSLVVLIQSSSFRLNEFRFRIELFKLGLKVIEHAHLERMKEDELEVFVDSLAYDPLYYQKVGHALKSKIDRCQKVQLVCLNSKLEYLSMFEESKLNIGDYSSLKNVGGQFPIGELFSEPKDLTQVNGELEIFAFGNKNFSVQICEKPFKVKIENGNIISTMNAPFEFEEILKEIEETEKKIWIRELGFGLNRAFTKKRFVSDIGAYERMCGIHLSVGAKHAMYQKEGFPKKKCRFHVDVFADVEKVLIDNEMVFEEGKYIV